MSITLAEGEQHPLFFGKILSTPYANLKKYDKINPYHLQAKYGGFSKWQNLFISGSC